MYAIRSKRKTILRYIIIRYRYRWMWVRFGFHFEKIFCLFVVIGNYLRDHHRSVVHRSILNGLGGRKGCAVTSIYIHDTDKLLIYLLCNVNSEHLNQSIITITITMQEVASALNKFLFNLLCLHMIINLEKTKIMQTMHKMCAAIQRHAQKNRRCWIRVLRRLKFFRLKMSNVFNICTETNCIRIGWLLSRSIGQTYRNKK